MPKPIKVIFGVALAGLFIVYGLEPLLKYVVAPIIGLCVVMTIIILVVFLFRKPTNGNT